MKKAYPSVSLGTLGLRPNDRRKWSIRQRFAVRGGEGINKATRIGVATLLGCLVFICTARVAQAGELVAWGNDLYEQCDVPSGSDFVVIASGNSHSLAIRSDGSLVAWGFDLYGQCDVPSGNDFVAVAGGENHSLALKSDGALVAWGSGLYGLLDVPSGTDFAAISTGKKHSLAMRSDGSLVAWGLNDAGQCDVPEGNDFAAILAGEGHSIALKDDGSLVGWGHNNVGQCDVPEGYDFLAIAGGESFGVALRSDGTLTDWGWYDYEVPVGEDFVAVSVSTGQGSSGHCVAIKDDGSLVAWGDNTYGRCDVPAGNNFLAIACGSEYTVAIIPGPVLGDMDGSGAVNNNDITPFVMALTYRTQYIEQYGLDPDVVGDIDGSGWMDNNDITPFVALLTGIAAPQVIPEPATLSVLTLGGLAAMRRWRR